MNKEVVLAPEGLDQLIDVLRAEGYAVFGPVFRDGAIVYDEIRACEDLPIGCADAQAAGTYRADRGKGQAFFGFTNGPQSWKKFLHPPTATLWKAGKTEDGWAVLPESVPAQKSAFLGVRSCDLHAIEIQDKVFLKGPYVDPSYRARRENSFIVAVNCTRAGGTCFCASMNTGPRVQKGFDILLTELEDETRHEFLVEAGSARGAELLGKIETKPSFPADRALADRLIQQAASAMGRTLETAGLKDLLPRNADSPRWDDVAERCLSCANCTMVCPTCFCTTVEDTTDLSGPRAGRRSAWDSCFTMAFSYLHGGSIRASVKSRYRQWLTHKFATWHDQFGSSGCVGCGRCITWCPASIDVTEEIKAIRDAETGGNAPRKEKIVHGKA